MRSATRAKTGKDPAYLKWIREQPCAVPGCAVASPTIYAREAAHVGMRGMSQKCADREAIPLCAWHHRLGPQSHHRAGKRFWSLHSIDREELIAYYNNRFEEEKR